MILVTGSSGLVGSEAVRYYLDQGELVVGIDNNGREEFFGAEGSIENNIVDRDTFYAYNVDITKSTEIGEIFNKYGSDISAVIHAAAQPSHDWSAKNPIRDFSVNAYGTLSLLEHTRKYCPKARFVFLSSNKTYGDNSNRPEFTEGPTRYNLKYCDSFKSWADSYYGFNELTPIDKCTHSCFGVSKLAADMYVQEYSRNFGLATACFRCGCLTGPNHKGVELHGFLSYLMKCTQEKKPYTVYGYGAKMVRDNLHSHDLIRAIDLFVQDAMPVKAFVCNMGGGHYSNCSMLEAIRICEELTGQKLNYRIESEHRTGDHIWWISDVRYFQMFYPDWQPTKNVRDILEEMV